MNKINSAQPLSLSRYHIKIRERKRKLITDRI